MDQVNDFGAENILRSYLKCPSFTGTEGENSVPAFLSALFNQMPYFKENPRLFGLSPIAGDALGRSVFYACVKGSSPSCVILMHHYDIVDLADYGAFSPEAFNPEAIEKALLSIQNQLDKNLREDLLGGDFLFGRGVCDMKGGGSVQIELINRLSQAEDFKASLVLLAVPDEENISAGMRHGVGLLQDLQKQHGFNYKMMINSEPRPPLTHSNEHNTGSRRIISFGSIGKVMPFVHVQGISSHAGAVFEGFNPLGLLGAIVSACEANPDFCENIGSEVSPPPTWLYLKDHKAGYDVSLPRSATGCLSVLTFKQSPRDVLEILRRICLQESSTYGKRLSRHCAPYGAKPKAARVFMFDEALGLLTPEDRKAYEAYKGQLTAKLKAGSIHALEASALCAAFLDTYLAPYQPLIILGIAPPYYPGVCADHNTLLGELNSFARERGLGISEYEKYYPFISDLSYASCKALDLEGLMPLYGGYYTLPEGFDTPSINIGPIGYDLHRMGERVHSRDLLVELPLLLEKAVRLILLQ